MTRDAWQNRNRQTVHNNNNYINNMTEVTAPLTPKRFWQEIAIAVAGSSNVVDKEAMTKWADYAINANNAQRIDLA